MRIIVVDSARGWERGVASGVDVAFGLAELGHDLTVVCHPRSVIREQLGGDERVTLKPIAIRFQLNLYRVFQLAALNHRATPDVVLATRPKDVSMSIVARRLLRRLPIVHRHAASSLPEDDDAYRKSWARALQALVVNSRTARLLLLERAPWLESVATYVIHDGKDLSRFRPRPRERARARAELGIPEDAFIVSLHGTLEPEANGELLIRAVAALPVELRVHALLVGGGPALAELRRLAAELRAPVIFSDTRQEIAAALSAADAATVLSTESGFSDRAIEAMACGLPMLISDTPSHTEQVEDGVEGVLIPPDRWREIAEAIRWLANDAEGRAQMGKAARERAVKEFSRERMVERYDTVLRETVETYRA